MGDYNGPNGFGLFAYLEYMDVHDDIQSVVGGCFNVDDASFQNVAYNYGIYAGWQPLGNGLNDCVYALAIDSNNFVLYAAGAFTNDGYEFFQRKKLVRLI